LNSPCYETPKTAIEKKRAKQPKEKKKRRKKKDLFCDEPRWIFLSCFELPCYETPKNTIKTIGENEIKILLKLILFNK
jgi:hypothetical protein